MLNGSRHYTGEAGEAYYQYQREAGEAAAIITARFFQQYVNATDAVLDFGCGGAFVLANLRAADKIGVELNPIAREVAKGNGVPVVESLDAVQAGSIDVAISNHCVEHVPHPIAALSGIRRTMKSNGRFVLVVPLDDWRVQKDFSALDIDHHLHTWTPRLLANTLSESGFKVVRIAVWTHAWPPGYTRLSKLLPYWLFDILCFVTAFTQRRRQLVAVSVSR